MRFLFFIFIQLSLIALDEIQSDKKSCFEPNSTNPKIIDPSSLPKFHRGKYFSTNNNENLEFKYTSNQKNLAFFCKNWQKSQEAYITKAFQQKNRTSHTSQAFHEVTLPAPYHAFIKI